MNNKRKKVLVFGAGPAGLGAGVHLLENGGSENFDVTIVNLDHMLGGKAKSWRDPVLKDGRFYDHGIHFVFGFYEHLPDLMERAGIDKTAVLHSNRGALHWYEIRDRRVHTLRVSNFKPLTYLSGAMYSGWTLYEKFNLAQWFARTYPTLCVKKDLTDLDDICFKAWALEKGMDYHFVRTSTLFRFCQDALYNWPFEISAYVNLVAMRKITNFKTNIFSAFSYDKIKFYIVNDGWSTQIWNPIGEYFKKLGGKFEFGRKLVGLKHDGRQITGVEVGKTTAGSGKSPVVPIAPGSEELISDFDYVISAIPMNNFRELNPDDQDMWRKPYFSNMYNLTGVVPVGMFAFFKENINFPYEVQVNGIAPPLFNALDYKRISIPYKNNKNFGSVIHMEGQETGFEEMSDKEMVDYGIECLSRLKGCERLQNATMQSYFLYRGNRNHSRYLLTDPGTFRFRPEIKSPFSNLYLAGDWVRDGDHTAIPCMDGAIYSGKKAADYVLEDCGLGPKKKKGLLF